MDKEKIKVIYKILNKEMKKYTIPLETQKNIKSGDPFFVLVGTILSSRTRDETTKKVTDKLFKEVKSFKDLEKINLEKLEKLVYPVGFYRNKAKQLKKLALQMKDLNYVVPQDIDELVKLSGVGRKTANLVVSRAFGIPAICVDVHVFRITNRIGIVESKNPLETEMKLREILPKRYWTPTNTVFVKLGQNICLPRKPNCEICPINKLCLKKI